MIVVLSTLLGFFRGFFREIASFAVILIAYFVSRLITERYFDQNFPDHGRMILVIVYLVIFIVLLLVGYFIMRKFNEFIEGSPLTILNLFLGGLFGFLRGIVLVLALIFLVSLTSLAKGNTLAKILFCE